MPNVVALIKDDRTRRQVEQYLNELEMEELAFATFKNIKDFQDVYFQSYVSQEEPTESEPAKEEEQGEELKVTRFKELDLIIFALDTLEEKATTWIDRLRTSLQEFKYWPEDRPVRLIMLKYEDDGISKLDLIHPLLDDLLYLPLDRLVFLQKVDIILMLPKRTTPRFLFNQEVQLPIEISKIVTMDRFSDVGLAIRNPVALKRGLPGQFYIPLPGDPNRLEVRGKVLRSEPHPQLPNQFLVYFSYFGVNRNQISQIRRALSKAPRYQGLKNEDKETVRYKPDDLFMSAADQKEFGVAVLDPDDAAAIALAAQVSKEMDRTKVITESSYSIFLHRYFEAGGSADPKSPPQATDVTDFYQSPFTLKVSQDLKVLSVEPSPDEQALFLGFPAQDMFSSPDKWLSLFKDKESYLVLEEAMKLVSSGRELKKLLIVEDSSGARRAVMFRFSNSDTDQVANLELTPANLSDITDRLASEQKSKSLEAIVINQSFVPSDTPAWIEGLRTRAVQIGLTESPQHLKFFLTTEHEGAPDRILLNTRDVLALLVKPVDHRQLLLLLSEYLPNENTLYRFDNLGWSEPNLAIHASKEVELEAISEFGATLKTSQKLVPGTIFYLRKSIYDNAPNNCLAARVYSCEEHPSDKRLFQVHCLYYGIQDAFLKIARTWIRENYANQKNQGQ